MTSSLDFFLPDGSIQMRPLGRLISKIENDPEFAEEFLAKEYRENDDALVIGITGPPGAGKSTLADGLVADFRSQGKMVAVIAVDPSSPFTGGAILGDRIRMTAHAIDPGVFIRSMSSRGRFGGVAPATVDVMNLLTSAGFDVVIIETVGVGQSEVDILHLVDTVLLVLMPGMGDDIQAIKAGIMEIADIFVVNKADKPGVEKLQAEIDMLMMLSKEHADWQPPMVEMVANEKKGFERLLEEIERHREYIHRHGTEVKRPKLEKRFRRMVEQKIGARIVEAMHRNERLEEWVEQVSTGQANPYATIQELDKKLKITWED